MYLLWVVMTFSHPQQNMKGNEGNATYARTCFQWSRDFTEVLIIFHDEVIILWDVLNILSKTKEPHSLPPPRPPFFFTAEPFTYFECLILNMCTKLFVQLYLTNTAFIEQY